ncbi:MAG: hypothetical protein Q9170_007255 [Blastenia crenularia]
MVKPTSAVSAPQFPLHTEPRVWFLSSGSSPIGIALSRQLLAHGDHVVHGARPGEISNPSNYRAAEFANFWTEEVLMKEGWKERAKAIELDERCEVAPIVGTVEELGVSPRTSALIRDQFETNYFGHVNIIKSTLPRMREKQCEINVLTNQITAPSQLSQYKSENNPAPLFRDIIGGILDRLGSTSQVTTDGRGNGRANFHPAFSEDKIVSLYPQLSEQMKARLLAETINALTAIGGHDNPPARHIVGHEAVGLVKEKLKTVSEELEEFVEISCAVDIDGDVLSPRQGTTGPGQVPQATQRCNTT